MQPEENFVSPEEFMAEMARRGDATQDELAVAALDNIINNVPRAVIPEETFKTFLPYLRDGQVESNGVNLEAGWVDIAGNMMNEVTVVDTSNRVLFHVPPVLDVSLVDARVSMFQEGGIQQAMRDNQRLAHNMPVIAAEQLRRDLAEAGAKLINPENPFHKQQTERWKAIFQHYDGVSKPTKETTEESRDDGFELDLSED